LPNNCHYYSHLFVCEKEKKSKEKMVWHRNSESYNYNFCLIVKSFVHVSRILERFSFLFFLSLSSSSSSSSSPLVWLLVGEKHNSGKLVFLSLRVFFSSESRMNQLRKRKIDWEEKKEKQEKRTTKRVCVVASTFDIFYPIALASSVLIILLRHRRKKNKKKRRKKKNGHERRKR